MQNQSNVPVIVVENVKKQFGDYLANNDISLKVNSGTIFGLLGPNGAGKTTLIRMINNIYIPDGGTITIFGKPVSDDTQNQVAYLPEERGLYKKQKVLDQLIYFAQLKGVEKSVAKKRAEQWLIRFDAASWAGKKIQDLSKGMAQKVQFISTLLHDPKLLILDEPFSGFDPINAELLKEVILELKSQGKTIILSTHVMHQVEQMCDDMCLINKGKAILQGNVREIKKSFGRNTILLEFEGDASFIVDNQQFKIVNQTAHRLELKIIDSNFDSKLFLNELNQKLTVFKFELVEPSFHEIFIQSVKGNEVEVG
ncbi:MAG: ATP-binding cassette domain-containing protein [Candidatus Kapaibacterium sp.]|nr:ATP-binding cassette domain-containing protein [Ignavibacteriota bacterium]